MMALLIGCSANEPLRVYETANVTRDRYVPIPESMTRPCEIVELPSREKMLAMSGVERLATLAGAYKAQRVQVEVCNDQLAEIAELGNE